jgi:ubiquitin C-terminal hydrolase
MRCTNAQMTSTNLLGSCAQDCLQAFTEREALGEDAGFKCSTCKRVQPATKQLTLRRCPPVLVLTLKRFSVSHLAHAVCACT